MIPESWRDRSERLGGMWLFRYVNAALFRLGEVVPCENVELLSLVPLRLLSPVHNAPS